MRDAYGRVGLVDVLAAGSRRAIRIDAKVGRIEFDRTDFLELRQDRHGTGRCVDAPLGFRSRHALHAMGTGLELERRIGAAADDAADDFLVATVLPRTLAEDI